MERRVLLAIFLAFLVLFVWERLFLRPAPKPAPVAGAPPAAGTPTASGAAGTAPGNSATPADKATPAPAASAKPTPPAQAEAAAPLVADAAERDVKVETRDVIAVFTNRGARLKSWRVKRYLDQRGEPQELVEQIPNQPLPFTLRTPDDAVSATLNNGLYTVTGEPGGGEISAPVDLRFEYRDSGGVQAVKTFHLDPASYIVSYTGTVKQGDRELSPAIVWGPAIGDMGVQQTYVKKSEALLFENGKVVRVAPSDIAKQPERDGDMGYVGVDDNYFLIAALQPGPSKVTFQAITIPPPPGTKTGHELVSYAIEAHDGDAPIKFFVGPKDFDVLNAIGPDVAKSINFGSILGPIVVPLLKSLKWVNGYVGNYGWSIIILTLIINAIMFPLRHKSVVSMRKMQEIQPEVKAIQERYSKLKATDPQKQKMNTELMALYKERGVNPASGCVPMLLTMPFIFAFYTLLSTAIELRGAPWFGWIHDLSAYDPYYVVPIAMGASQIWQQRIAPAAGMDPIQQKMMLLMPVFFTYLFLWYPSGVALYWFVNNIWAIGQQYLTNYMIGPPPNVQPAKGSAGERRMKRAGSGKTDAAARDN